MKRRWRLLIGLALLLLVGGALLHPDVHWWLLGWYRGEAFYQGRPSSYWLQQLRATAKWHYAAIAKVDPKPAWAPEVLRPLWKRPPGLEALETDPEKAIPLLREVIQQAGEDTLIDRQLRFFAQVWIDQMIRQAEEAAEPEDPGPRKVPPR